MHSILLISFLKVSNSGVDFELYTLIDDGGVNNFTHFFFLKYIYYDNIHFDLPITYFILEFSTTFQRITPYVTL